MKPRKKIKKEQRLIENLQRVVQQYMTGSRYSPMTEKELRDKLSIPEQHIELFSTIMETMVQQKVVGRKENRYILCENPEEIVSGVIRMHPRGFGFLQPGPNHPYPEVFIPKHATGHAVDGDTVEVVVDLETVSEKGPEGRVISILERARSHMAGIIRTIDDEGRFTAYVPLLGKARHVVLSGNDNPHMSPGDRVVLEVLEWGDEDSETVCRFSHKIGHIEDPSCDIPAAIEEFEIRNEFPTPVQQQAEAFGNRITPSMIKDRLDLRELETFTIDPDTAKDFDDALSLSKDAKGHYHLGVHIADVTHYVTPGTPLDHEAQTRCNSTYFPGKCVPMLPHELSDNLCSLKPNVNRLAASVLMTIDQTGDVIDYRFAKTVINSDKRFSYREAKEVLDGKKKSPHLETLNLMVELCHLFKRKRYERGSIEFSMPELVVKVDDDGIPTHTEIVEYDITHQLVEEFMLKANEMVATHLSEKGKALAYRVHDEPNEENLREFAALARAFGYDLPNKPEMSDYQKLFEEAQHTPYGPFLATSFIRRMKMATYSADNIGHYGLALPFYCHFTSPIRRYTDLVVHRILFGDEQDVKKLQEIALRCSDQERISAKAEGSVVLLKKLRLLKKMAKEKEHPEFEAVVTRVKPFGFFFEIIGLMLESFFHVSELPQDYFVFEESKMRLKGNSTGQIYQAGDKISVGLTDVDLIYLESKWYLIPGSLSHRNDSGKTRTQGEKKQKRRRRR